MFLFENKFSLSILKNPSNEKIQNFILPPCHGFDGSDFRRMVYNDPFPNHAQSIDSLLSELWFFV